MLGLEPHTLFTTTLAQTCDTALYSANGQTCLGFCANTILTPCQRSQCFVFCANQENNSACAESSNANCLSMNPTDCDCINVPQFNAIGAIEATFSPANAPGSDGCSSVAQSTQFDACINAAGSACAVVNADPAAATQQQQCACAFQIQSCQSLNVPCLSPDQGTLAYFQSSCLAASSVNSCPSVSAFHQCCFAAGSQCLNNPTGCGCAQQVQSCQVAQYGCQNIAFGTQSNLQSACSTCSNANLLSTFHQCCNVQGSACNQINTNNQYGGNVPQQLACNCSTQVQLCQQQNQGCQNAAQGSAEIISNTCSTCSGNELIAFQACVNTGFCSQVETQFPFGGAPASLLCSCAQQVQACQQNSQYSGCVNSDWGSQNFMTNVCVVNPYPPYSYTTHYGSATTVAVSMIVALVALVASM